MLYYNFLFFLWLYLKYLNFKNFIVYKNVNFFKIIFFKDNFFGVVLIDVSEMNMIEEVKKLVEFKVGVGGLNLFINNVGINKKVMFEIVILDMMLDIFNINVNGFFFIIKVIK